MNPTKEQKRFECDICHVKFTRRHGLQRHQESTHLNMTFSCKNCLISFKRVDALKKHCTQPCVPKLGKNPIISIQNVSNWLENYTIPKKLDESIKILEDTTSVTQGITVKTPDISLSQMESTTQIKDCPNPSQVSCIAITPSSKKRTQSTDSILKIKQASSTKKSKKLNHQDHLKLNYTTNNLVAEELYKKIGRHDKSQKLKPTHTIPIIPLEAVDDNANGFETTSLGALLDKMEYELSTPLDNNIKQSCLFDDLHLSSSRDESAHLETNVSAPVIKEKTINSPIEPTNSQANYLTIQSSSSSTGLSSLVPAEIDWAVYHKLAQDGRRTPSQLASDADNLTAKETKHQHPDSVTLSLDRSRIPTSRDDLGHTLALCIQDLKRMCLYSSAQHPEDIFDFLNDTHERARLLASKHNQPFMDSLMDAAEILNKLC